MTTDDYLAALEKQFTEMAGLISTSIVQREIDTAIGWGFLKGQITFVDGTRFEFMEQLPPERTKFRFQYMDSAGRLIARWDSAPHHNGLSTFPFHKHTPIGIEPHGATTTLDILAEIAKSIRA